MITVTIMASKKILKIVSEVIQEETAWYTPNEDTNDVALQIQKQLEPKALVCPLLKKD
jgi:hypothetical protein